MSDYRPGSPTVCSIHLHIVWIPTYRRTLLRGELADRVREIVREEGRKARGESLRGHIAAAHGQVMVSIPPQGTIRRRIPRLKGKRSYLLCNEFPALRQRYGGRHVWVRGDFCRSSGHGTDEGIKASIARQDHSTDEGFRIEGEPSPVGDTP
jgi:putative transposase